MFGHWAGVLVHLLLLICNSLGFGTDNSINTVVRNVLRNYQNDAEKKQINEAKRLAVGRVDHHVTPASYGKG